MPDKHELIVKSTIHSLFHNILTLTKPLVTLGVTLTSITGYIINSDFLSIYDTIALGFGVALLSGGAAAFNHVIERKTDAQMQRTRHRPIASGRISPAIGLLIGFVLILSGLTVLASKFALICSLLGILNVIWYNIVYTPLKKVTVWAVFVGSITGVIPYFMGVTAATDLHIPSVNVFVGIYLLMWQIPHFFILSVRYGEDYKKAGMASIINVASVRVVWLISHVWVIACCIMMLLFPLLNLLHNSITTWITVLLSLAVFAIQVRQIFVDRNRADFIVPFMVTNLMQVAFMVILIFDRLAS